MSDEEIMNVSHSNQHIAHISDKLEKLMSMDNNDNNDKMDIYHSYIKDGKNAARQGDMSKALDFFKRAHKIHPSEKLKSRINKIEELIAQQDSESDDEEFVNIGNSGLMLFRELHDKLYEHQREGVSFMYSLYRDGLKGGILADDMGLGKTIQIIAFLSGMYDAELVKHTLLVMPTSLITNWTKEFSKWTPGMRVKEFHGTSKVERTRNMEKVQRRGGVVITTYQMLIQNWQQIASYNGQEFKWDYMILDEAHKIKTSSTKTAKSAHAIPARNRVLLTGTPVQNNLREMWALFDFACQGALLGTSKTFKTEYENPITRAREKDATPGEKALGFKMSQNLMAIIKPYFLRRTKAEVQKKNAEMEKEHRSKSENGDIQVSDTEKLNGAIMPELRRKNDLIIWTYLSEVQEDIYRQFLSLDHIKELLTTTRSPLAELNVIKKLCDHPRLLSAAATVQLGLEDRTPKTLQAEEDKGTSHSLDNIPDDTLIAESGKMVFLMALLERLRMEGHRTLVFAHFRKVLDILERVLGNRGIKTIRLDGTITQLAERERLISLFQNDKKYSVFLLTTQVGGVGITLTAANRVVIYDPSWNPATDAQAVDRAYRIGQTENVVIYRLITCGTVEEKIYRRQVFKDSIIRQTTGDKKNPFRYFSKQELKELFTLEETRSSSTQLQLQSLHSRHRRTDPVLDEHIAYLHSMEMFGISDHDLMFSQDSNQHEEDPDDQEAHQYIEGRVRKAQELMKAESELHMQLAENMESSTEPAWHRQSTQHNKERSHGNQDPNRKPRSPVVYVEGSSNGSPDVVELDQSGSNKEDSKQNHTNGFVDLTVDDSMEGKQPDHPSDTTGPNAFPSQHSFIVEQSEVKAEDISVHKVSSDMESADAASEYNTSLDGFASADIHDRKLLNQESFCKLDNSENQATAMEEEHPLNEPLHGKRLSILQISNVSLNDEESSIASGIRSFEGNFNLLLEDSENDISTVHNLLEEPDVETQEEKLLSQLQIQGSFNVDKSLAEFKQEHGMSLNHSYVSDSDQSGNESLIKTKKKHAAVIYDSEEEEEVDEQLQNMSSHLSDSFQALEASTPKTLPSGRTPLRARSSFGGNVSVASRRSMIESIVEDVESDLDLEEEEEEQFSVNGSGVVDGDSEETSVHSVDELEIDETKGETLLTENEEDENDQETDFSASLGASESGGDAESILEESTKDPQSASVHSETSGSDQMASGSDHSTNCSNLITNSSSQASGAVLADLEASTVEPIFDSEGKSYEALVCRGKQCYSEGKLHDALDFFLKAIDISSGDTEVQLLVIQLYRQMSEQRRSSLPREFSSISNI